MCVYAAASRLCVFAASFLLTVHVRAAAPRTCFQSVCQCQSEVAASWQYVRGLNCVT